MVKCVTYVGVITWKLSPYYWPIVRETIGDRRIALTKHQWYGILMCWEKLLHKQPIWWWFVTSWRSRDTAMTLRIPTWRGRCLADPFVTLPARTATRKGGGQVKHLMTGCDIRVTDRIQNTAAGMEKPMTLTNSLFGKQISCYMYNGIFKDPRKTYVWNASTWQQWQLRMYLWRVEDDLLK